MTVCAALTVPGAGAVLACDGRVATEDGNIITDLDEKWLIGPGYMAACAGTLGGLWFELRARPPRSFSALRQALATYGSDDVEVVCFDGRHLWRTDAAGDSMRAPRALAIGCGAPWAQGVIDACPVPTTLAEAERTARMCVASASRHNTACGGRTRVLVHDGRKASLKI